MRNHNASDELIAEPEAGMLERLNEDLRESARTMTKKRVRDLVDVYYQIQDTRIRFRLQERDAIKANEPSLFIGYMHRNYRLFERDIKAAMRIYCEQHVPTKWAMSIVGIGEVLAAGLYAHFDATNRPYAGQFMRYAGLDPTLEWLGKDKAAKLVKSIVKNGNQMNREQLASIAATAGRRLSWLEEKLDGKKPTVDLVTRILSKIPHNKKLKDIRRKLGDCVMKFFNHPNQFYGTFYLERKMLDWQKNLRGELSDQARKKLREYRIGKTTDAYKCYAGGYDPRGWDGPIPPIDPDSLKLLLPFVGIGNGVQMLPPAHIVARAQRYAAKIFVSHLHEVMYFCEYGKLPPDPWIIEHGGHKDYIPIPNSQLVPGYIEACKKAGRKYRE